MNSQIFNYKYIIIFHLFFFLICISVQSQIVISEGDATPDNNAILDLQSGNKGFLLSRVALDDINTAAPLTEPVTAGIIIYSEGGSEPDGFYLWVGASWKKLNVPVYNHVLSDIENNVYSTVKIGNQVWMAENLRTTLYSDGSPITGVYSYNDSEYSAQLWGRLYTWEAVMNGEGSSNTNPSGVQGVCPDGWHVPSDTEWTELFDFLKNNGYTYRTSQDTIAKALAELTTGWDLGGLPGSIGDDQGSNNSSGFSALPGGSCYLSNYSNGGNEGYWWSSTENGSNAWSIMLSSQQGIVFRNSYDKVLGFSVRCIKD